MSSTTPRAQLPLLAAAQAQKHVTHNDALLELDALLFARFLSRNVSTPPPTPADGDSYLVKPTASGAWTGQNGQIAYANAGVWRFAAPFTGLTAYVVDETKLVVFNGTAWVDYASTLALQNVPLVGVNASADATNKFAVSSSALLFNNVGNGVQVKLNKNAVTDTASLLYQTGFSGRAEIGLTGDDDFHFKVSPDGTSFFEGLHLSKSDGAVDFLASESALASAATCDIGSTASLNVQITGTTTITSFGTKANKFRVVRFAGVLTLTHNATGLILLGGASRTTAAGDVGIYTSDASGNWRERDFARAASNPGDFATKSGSETLTNKLVQAQAGSAAAPSHSFSANTNTGLFNPAANVCAVATNGVETARFSPSANGIGTTSPARLFCVSNAGAEGLEIGPGNANGDPSGAVTSIYYNRSASAYLSNNQVALLHTWQIAGSEAARIDSNRRLLVGTAALPASNVAAAIHATGGATQFGLTVDVAGISGTTTRALEFSIAGSVVGSVTYASSSSVAYNTTSDARLKNVLAEQADYRGAIKALWIGDFEWKTSGEKSFGVMAQQASTLMPHGIGVTRPKDDGDHWQASSEPFAHLALWGVKDLYALIEAQNERIIALETRLREVEAQSTLGSAR